MVSLVEHTVEIVNVMDTLVLKDMIKFFSLSYRGVIIRRY